MATDVLLPNLTTEQLLQRVPGARELAGYTIPADLNAPYPTPYGDNPPIEWFLEPHPEVVPGATGIITADGRFCAMSHEWDRCHNAWTDEGVCWKPPRSITGNRYFHQGSVVARAGDTLIQIPCGAIPLGGGHADIDADIFEAMRHYDRPERITVRARAVETDAGVVMCGALVPGVTHAQVGVMRAAALSGDWRWVPELGAQEFLGPCFVARPGLCLGLEQAAIDAAFWDIARDLLTSDRTVTTASGLVVPASVMTVPALWTPRSTITTNLSAAVVAAAQGAPMAKHTITIEVPEGVAPDVFEKAMTVVAGGAIPFTTAPREGAATTAPAPSCGCSGTPAALPVTAGRTAAAGSTADYTELNENVTAAIRDAFGTGEDDWIWVKRWDDGWAVFELETTNPMTGARSTNDVWVALSIAPDGSVAVDRASAVVGHMEFRPDVSSDMAMVTLAAARMNVTADGEVSSEAFNEVHNQLDDLATTVAALAEDVATIVGRTLTPAEAVEELPMPPELA